MHLPLIIVPIGAECFLSWKTRIQNVFYIWGDKKDVPNEVLEDRVGLHVWAWVDGQPRASLAAFPRSIHKSHPFFRRPPPPTFGFPVIYLLQPALHILR